MKQEQGQVCHTLPKTFQSKHLAVYYYSISQSSSQLISKFQNRGQWKWISNLFERASKSRFWHRGLAYLC
jgi:hypothetical protein